jgi:hypothetical protein
VVTGFRKKSLLLPPPPPPRHHHHHRHHDHDHHHRHDTTTATATTTTTYFRSLNCSQSRVSDSESGIGKFPRNLDIHLKCDTASRLGKLQSDPSPSREPANFYTAGIFLPRVERRWCFKFAFQDASVNKVLFFRALLECRTEETERRKGEGELENCGKQFGRIATLAG